MVRSKAKMLPFRNVIGLETFPWKFKSQTERHYYFIAMCLVSLSQMNHKNMCWCPKSCSYAASIWMKTRKYLYTNGIGFISSVVTKNYILKWCPIQLKSCWRKKVSWSTVTWIVTLTFCCTRSFENSASIEDCSSTALSPKLLNNNCWMQDCALCLIFQLELVSKNTKALYQGLTLRK